jgi:hypothetical protein
VNFDSRFSTHIECHNIRVCFLKLLSLNRSLLHILDEILKRIGNLPEFCITLVAHIIEHLDLLLLELLHLSDDNAFKGLMDGLVDLLTEVFLHLLQTFLHLLFHGLEDLLVLLVDLVDLH